MLLQLNIKNFALIEELNIEFDKGFNVLTGETGSGKSILIDAINYVLGSKFNKNLIRTGENKTYVEGIFTLENKKTEEILKNFDIDYDDFIIISRETFKSGKSIAKINGKSVILSQVKKISETLMDIHGQHDNQSLLDSNKHIIYLDWYGRNRLSNYLENYTKNYAMVNEINKKIDYYESQETEASKKIEFLKYQMNDIDKGKLREGEEEELKEKFVMLSNAEKLDTTLNNCHNILYSGTEGSKAVYDNLDIVIRELKNIEDFSKGVKNVIDTLENSYYSIEQCVHDINQIKNNIYYDKNEIDYINERIYTIEQYKNKYGDSISDILQYRIEIEKEYNEIENRSDIIKNLNSEKDIIISNLNKICDLIHSKRCEIAKELEYKIKNELNFIGLEKCTMKINVNKTEKFYEKGCDIVRFNIATNPGEPLKPLDNIVSGGELSRVMLALKTVFIDNDNIPTVIFDEIDTGISGRIAQSVAGKMYKISTKHQVFCITHLPQIASMSDHNYLVRKEVIDNKTYTFVSEMSHIEKMNCIAKMIGGSEITNLALEHSKEMLNLAQKKKKKLA